MSDSQKHTVLTDALETLGTILDKRINHERDAIHLAVLPVYAGDYLKRGQRCIIKGDMAFPANKTGTDDWDEEDDATGIIDPFLSHESVEHGNRVWFIVLPRTITSLRHVWDHPLFPDPDLPAVDHGQQEDVTLEWSKEWMKTYAATKINVSYEQLMQGAKDFLSKGRLMNEGGRFEGVYVDDDFWRHYGILTGQIVPLENRESFFSCSC